MYLANFTALNKLGEQALSLTRSAHGHDHNMVCAAPSIWRPSPPCDSMPT